MKIVALAGGVGGAKLCDGLSRLLPIRHLSIIVNVGDDFEHFGLLICPDLDTVCYTLARKANPVSGWGRSNETWHAMETVRTLGGPDWFNLGDRDLGLHLERSRWVQSGAKLSEFYQNLCHCWNIKQRIIPATDSPLRTIVRTTSGNLPFQEYFVREKYQPRVQGFEFLGSQTASPAPGVIDEIQAADAVVICPSNPWVSIDPILSVPGIREALNKKIVVGVSPIIGGETVKGPAAKMFKELGQTPSALNVARHFQDYLKGFILDQRDIDQADEISRLGITTLSVDTLMVGVRGRTRLAKNVLALCLQLIS